MSILYPTAIDTFTNPTASNNLSNPSHSLQHSNENDAIVALETKVGVNNSTDPASLDYKVANSVMSSSVFTTDNALVRVDRPTTNNRNVQQAAATMNDVGDLILPASRYLIAADANLNIASNAGGTGVVNVGCLGDHVQIAGNGGDIDFGGGSTASETRWLEPSGSGFNYFALKAQAMAANTVYLLPTAKPSTRGLWMSDSSGSMSWLENTDWTSFTPTINAVTSNPTKGATRTENCWWKRDGHDMLIIFLYRQTSAGTAGTGTYLIPLPNSVSVDTSVVTTGSFATQSVCGSIVGHGRAEALTGGGTYDFRAAAAVFCYDSSNLAIHGIYASQSGSDSGVIVGSGALDLSNGTVVYSFQARVPISGW